MIRAVLFDVDGVLIDSLRANWKFFSDLLKVAGHKPPTLAEYRKIFHLPQIEVIRTLVDSDEAEVQRIVQLGKSNRVTYHDELVSLQPGVKKVLNQLHEKYDLGLVSSRVADGVYELPVLAELVPLFKVVVTYEDTDRHKPDPQPLQLALDKLRLDPLEAVYVGDATTDVLAAQATGMRIIVYPQVLPEFTVDATVTSFDQLPAVIDSLI